MVCTANVSDVFSKWKENKLWFCKFWTPSYKARSGYRKIYQTLKSRIQEGIYSVDDCPPSENDLCKTYFITRTTARRAFNELLKDVFLEKERGSRVLERRKTLGLLTVKGVYEAVVENVNTSMQQHPQIVSWLSGFPFPSKK